MRCVCAQILHVPDIDFNTTVWTLLEGLQAIKAYSGANPDHEPIAIYIEFKFDDLAQYIGPLGEQLVPVILNATSTPGPDRWANPAPDLGSITHGSTDQWGRSCPQGNQTFCS